MYIYIYIYIYICVCVCICTQTTYMCINLASTSGPGASLPKLFISVCIPAPLATLATAFLPELASAERCASRNRFLYMLPRGMAGSCRTFRAASPETTCFLPLHARLRPGATKHTLVIAVVERWSCWSQRWRVLGTWKH